MSPKESENPQKLFPNFEGKLHLIRRFKSEVVKQKHLATSVMSSFGLKQSQNISASK